VQTELYVAYGKISSLKENYARVEKELSEDSAAWVLELRTLKEDFLPSDKLVQEEKAALKIDMTDLTRALHMVDAEKEELAKVDEQHLIEQKKLRVELACLKQQLTMREADFQKLGENMPSSAGERRQFSDRV